MTNSCARQPVMQLRKTPSSETDTQMSVMHLSRFGTAGTMAESLQPARTAATRGLPTVAAQHDVRQLYSSRHRSGTGLVVCVVLNAHLIAVIHWKLTIPSAEVRHLQ